MAIVLLCDRCRRSYGVAAGASRPLDWRVEDAAVMCGVCISELEPSSPQAQAVAALDAPKEH